MKLTIQESYTYSDDFTEKLRNELMRLKKVETLRKTLTRKGFTLVDSEDYNVDPQWDPEDMSFDRWEKKVSPEQDTIVVHFYYDEDYDVVDIHVWEEPDEDLD